MYFKDILKNHQKLPKSGKSDIRIIITQTQRETFLSNY